MRSLLFVPGDDERKMAKGFASCADALILDLEDAVAPARKGAAREICAKALQSADTTKKLFVRVNALDTGQTLADLAAIVRGRPYGIVLPKCRGGDDTRLVGHYLSALEAREGIESGATRILPIATENGASMFGLGTYAGAGRLCGIFWGGEDLAADLGAIANRDTHGRYAAPYELARSLTLFAAAAAQVDAIDAVYTNFRDLEGLKAEAVDALRDGFSAKAAIHPDQVEPINAAFTPSAADVAWAKRVIAAFDESPGAGVASLDGRMLDRPHYRSAQRVLSRARTSNES
jgi:citrate lyase subunit beta / citryl-CoA lyase